MEVEVEGEVEVEVKVSGRSLSRRFECSQGSSTPSTALSTHLDNHSKPPQPREWEN